MNSIQNKSSVDKKSPLIGKAGRRELLAWAFYDFANSGYTTVVQTTIFSTYLVLLLVLHKGLHRVYQPCFGLSPLALPILSS
jgi:MFS-type transporter involved in bile tolerance (Atg22 family)